MLREFLIKGFVLDDGRLKEPGGFDYFDELLARIRDIRASEKRFYQKVRDLFKASSVDYDGTAETAKAFFATIQNKLVFAVTGHTAAELIVARADPARPNMALTAWTGERVRKTDVTVSKNYLDTQEIESLNRLTTMFLDFAEERASRRQEIRMAEWIAQTDRFLAFNERDVLQGKGRMAHERMTEIVHSRFEAFDASRRAAEAVEGRAGSRRGSGPARSRGAPADQGWPGHEAFHRIVVEEARSIGWRRWIRRAFSTVGQLAAGNTVPARLSQGRCDDASPISRP